MSASTMGETPGADPIVGWLLAPASGASTVESLVEGLAAQLLASDVDVFRSSLSLPTLHPELELRNITWTVENGAVGIERESSLLSTPFYLDSPPARIHRGEDEIRCRLEGPEPDLRFGICHDLKAIGATDYVAMVLPFSDGRRTFASWATRRPGGFRDADVDRIRALVPAVSLRLELASTKLAMASLLEVYLGHNAASRVLAGAFRRGAGETVRAAIWTCDLRGFTSMTDARPVSEVIATLDRYFETVCAPIGEGSGEVLKFIGDAVLAIFPAADDEAGACTRALAAAKGAIDGVRRWNEERAEPIRIGIGLHLGDVTYGNIGAQRRLDFTVIGAAVNEACRVEPLCKELGREVIATDAFAEKVGPTGLVSLGERTLRGVAEPKRLFGVQGY